MKNLSFYLLLPYLGFSQSDSSIVQFLNPGTIASTLVQVSKLFRDDLLIEVEATIIIPK